MSAVKKKPKKETQQPEKVIPKTFKEVAEERMAELLKFAGEARKSHIKLTNVAYGQDLSKELLALAEAVESLFKDMQTALDSGDEKVLASLLEKAKLKEEEGEKAKAWMGGAHAINIQEFPQAKHYSNYLCNLLFTCGISLKAWMGGAHSMTIQEFPQAKRYYDSLCIFFTCPSCGISFPILLFTCPGCGISFPTPLLSGCCQCFAQEAWQKEGG